MSDSLVKNAGDEGQVAKAAKEEKNAELRFKEDMATVLSSKQGRRVIWRLLEECKVFNSVWDPTERIRYLVGKQDLGHQVLAWVTNCSEDALLMMMKEAKELKNV